MKTHHILVLLLVFVIVAVPSCSPQPSLMEMEEWDLVWISDSSGWGVPEVYAAMVEEDTGIQINVNQIAMGRAVDILAALQGEDNGSFDASHLADYLREAELIVLHTTPPGSWGEDNPADWNCVDFAGNYVNNCELSTFDNFIALNEAIYELIFELRDGQPIILRAYDAYNPRVSNFQEDGCFAECTACWDNYNTALHQSAATYNVPVAEVFAAWNGTGWSQDPVAMGYTTDGEHPSELGATLMAEALRATGYEPVSP